MIGFPLVRDSRVIFGVIRGSDLPRLRLLVLYTNNGRCATENTCPNNDLLQNWNVW